MIRGSKDHASTHRACLPCESICWRMTTGNCECAADEEVDEEEEEAEADEDGTAAADEAFWPSAEARLWRTRASVSGARRSWTSGLSEAFLPSIDVYHATRSGCAAASRIILRVEGEGKPGKSQSDSGNINGPRENKRTQQQHV